MNYAFKFCSADKRTDIMLCYVAEESKYQSKSKEMESFLEKKSIPGHVIVNGKVSIGSFVEALLNEQSDYKSDLMIMGTKGVNKALSNTSQITLGAHCPASM